MEKSFAMNMIRIVCFLGILLATLPSQAKKYKYVLNPPFEIEQVRVAVKGTKFVQSWAVAKNADKAIEQAKLNAVAAMLFTGIAPNDVLGAGVTPPLFSQGMDAYAQNKEYFDQFFGEGVYLKYAVDVNSTYPTGQNNVKTPQGRRVGVYLQLLYDQLREDMIKEGLIKSMGSQLRF